MVSASCLLDTDVLIDWLQGHSWTKELISSRSVPLYCNAPLHVNVALIAATAWVKRLPLLTRNRKHYEFIVEITLADLPRASD